MPSKKSGRQRVIDRGYNALKRRWMRSGGKRVATGIMGEAGSDPRTSAIADGDAVTNLMIAAVHEFGAPSVGVPERSWLRAYVDENEKRIRAMIRAVAEDIIAGKITEEVALGRLGSKIVGEIQDRISEGIAPELSDRRKAEKEVDGKPGDTPLIDSGQFWQAIQWAVRG